MVGGEVTMGRKMGHSKPHHMFAKTRYSKPDKENNDTSNVPNAL
jgi:hypothetical protein